MTATTVVALPVDAITPGDNHRKHFADDDLAALAESIREVGLLQPITVRPRVEGPTPYQIIAGERRWRAHLLAALPTIECIVRSLDDIDAEKAMAAENLGRADLNPMEEAHAYARLRDDHGCTVAEIAEAVGVAPFRVRWRLDLLTLAPDVADMVAKGTIAVAQGRAMRDLDHDRQRAAVKVLSQPGMTTQRFEEVVATLYAAQCEAPPLFAIDAEAEAAAQAEAARKAAEESRWARPSRSDLLTLVRSLADALEATGATSHPAIARARQVQR